MEPADRLRLVPAYPAGRTFGALSVLVPGIEFGGAFLPQREAPRVVVDAVVVCLDTEVLGPELRAEV
jgi:hypothetical protein